MSDAATAAAAAVGYVGAGTVEFLLDGDGNFSFLEMNTRLQVEHPVTEMVTGLDLVELQLSVAGGDPLPDAALNPTIGGHAIEVRLCAEDPDNGYMPSSGTFRRFEFAEIDGVRVDRGVADGSVISPFYDSMIAKVIAHAPTSAGAIDKLQGRIGDGPSHRPDHQPRQLLGLLGTVGDEWRQLDTGWLDSHPFAGSPTSRPPSWQLPRVALGTFATHGLDRLPAGWRNNPSQMQHGARRRPTGRATATTAPAAVAEALVDEVALTDAWLPALNFIETEIDGDVVFVSRGPVPICRAATLSHHPTMPVAPGRRSRRCPDRSCVSMSASATQWSPASRCWRWRR